MESTYREGNRMFGRFGNEVLNGRVRGFDVYDI